MGYHNGVPHTKQERTFWVRPDSKRHKLTCAEYLPLVVLGILMVGVLAHGLLPK